MARAGRLPACRACNHSTKKSAPRPFPKRRGCAFVASNVASSSTVHQQFDTIQTHNRKRGLVCRSGDLFLGSGMTASSYAGLRAVSRQPVQILSLRNAGWANVKCRLLTKAAVRHVTGEGQESSNFYYSCGAAGRSRTDGRMSEFGNAERRQEWRL